MTQKRPEDILNQTLAETAASISACLANAEVAVRPETPYYRDHELDRAAALLHASARLADALARLRGDTQNIRVIREGGSPDRGSNRRRAKAHVP